MKTYLTLYVYVNGKVAYEKRGDKQLYLWYDSYGNLAALRYFQNANDENGVLVYATTNAQGDVVGLYTGSGTQCVWYEYDAWGNLVDMTDLSGVGIGTINPIRYRGYYYDTETGLYYCNSRYYDSEIGRFINADGYVSTGQGVLGHNMFAYCLNNPIMYVDYYGSCAIAWSKGFHGPCPGYLKPGCMDRRFFNGTLTESTGTTTTATTTITVPPQTPPNKMSEDGVKFIAEYEVFKETPYDDGYGHLTIGYGHLIQENETFVSLTKEQALELLATDLGYAEKAVAKHSATYAIVWDQNQYDAFVSLAMNSGSDFKSVMDNIVAGEDPYTAFGRIIKSGGKESLGLYRRRMDEADMFVLGTYKRTYRGWGK